MRHPRPDLSPSLEAVKNMEVRVLIKIADFLILIKIGGGSSEVSRPSERLSQERSMTHNPARRPLYASTFRCIGGACEDTCCRDMAVMVDKATYDKYQNFPPGEIRSLLQRHVTRNTVDANDILYAIINPASSNYCPLFAADRLCGLQKQFGSEVLCATCSIYPRVLNSVDGVLETSLYLSCPEAARLILLNPESTLAEGNPASSHFRTDQFSHIASDSGAIHKPYAYFDEVQALAITMIQDRTRPMWHRLFLLGMFCASLDRIVEPAQDSTVPKIIAEYRDILATGALRDELERLPKNPATQLDVVLRLTDQRVRAGGTGERFLECWQEFHQGIGYSPESTAASDAQHYAEGEELCHAFFARNPFILENYLLNYTFRTLFPFGRKASAHHTPQNILAEYALMITQYAMVKGLLIGIASHHRDAFGTEHVVKLIQSFSRAVEHSPVFLKQVNEFIKGRKLDTVEGFATLLACKESVPEVASEAAAIPEADQVARVAVGLREAI
jgi:lysine-N-methylase